VYRQKSSFPQVRSTAGTLVSTSLNVDLVFCVLPPVVPAPAGRRGGDGYGTRILSVCAFAKYTFPLQDGVFTPQLLLPYRNVGQQQKEPK
jgi:hypothetical protein